jgi:heme/copper-type cytochrome/quinol oxidase subunit 4
MLMIYDETLHRRRGLGAWERLGHPLDTISVLFPLSLAALLEFSETNLQIFIAASAFSCLLVTKDEFVHARECDAHEHWVHAVLFILHPLVFVATGALWWIDPTDIVLAAQPGILGLFFIYQIIFWSYVWKPIAR